MNLNPPDRPFADVAKLLNSYEQQAQQLENDTDAALQQLQINTYQMLIQVQQQKLEIYTQSPVDVQRLRQLDHLTIALLECAKAQQPESFSRLRQAENALRYQIKINCGLSLYFPPQTDLPDTTDIDDLFS